MNNSMLGGPIRMMAVAVASVLCAGAACAEVVTLGVGAEMESPSPVALSKSPKRIGVLDHGRVMLHTKESASAATTHLQIAGNGPHNYTLSFDIQIGLPPLHHERAVPSALRGTCDPGGSMLLSIDACQPGLQGALLIEIINQLDGTQMAFEIDYEDPTFEIILDAGTYRLLLSGLTDGAAQLEEGRSMGGIPAPGTLLMAGPLAAFLRRRHS